MNTKVVLTRHGMNGIQIMNVCKAHVMNTIPPTRVRVRGRISRRNCARDRLLVREACVRWCDKNLLSPRSARNRCRSRWLLSILHGMANATHFGGLPCADRVAGSNTAAKALGSEARPARSEEIPVFEKDLLQQLRGVGFLESGRGYQRLWCRNCDTSICHIKDPVGNSHH